ncbi:MAG: pilus (MSHA type) biogenesis protein MshL [Nitrospiraceae bacterium]|nr:MAG: pilus (MSHA type) biogenesis protein MshL [Nitrospiraceae bacterium]
MAVSGEDKMKRNTLSFFCCSLFAVCCLLAFNSCSSAQPKKEIKEAPDFIAQQMETSSTRQTAAAPKAPEPVIPEFAPAKEADSPLQTRTVSVSARNTPLRDVLFIIAETANLNLVMERGVDAELPVTMTLKNMSVGDALSLVLDSSDYFYSVKENILTVKAVETEIFEIGHPNVIQEYRIKTGGDILSGTSSVSSGAAGNAVSGDVTIQSASDPVSFNFWDSLEKSLDTLLKTQGAEQSRKVQPVFTVNRMAGAVMVTASKKDLQKVTGYITNLKKVLNRQVLVEARIVEVQLSEGLKYGIDWNTVNKWFGVGKTSFGTEVFADIVDSGGPHFQFTVTENDNFSLLLRALQEQGDVRTLSNPRVNIMNGQTALLSVGRNTSFISRVETVTTSGGDATLASTTFTVETNSVLSGVIFGIAPFINGNGEITLTITPIVSNLVSLEEKSIGSGTNAVDIRLPTVDLREMTTVVKVLDGQIVIIGGLIDEKERLNEDKVPFLGKIPILGPLFRSVDNTNEKTELVIMLIPRIVS